MYSTIRISSRCAHVFDYDNDKILCGVNRWERTPFRINKSKYDQLSILERHKAFAERRGGPNPYKFTCVKCQQILEGQEDL